MKLSLAVLLLTLYASNIYCFTEQQIQQTAKLIRRSCKTKSKSTDEELDSMKEGKFDNVSQNAKCYLACAMQMIKLMKKDGTPDIRSALKQVPLLPEPRRQPTLTSIDHCKDAADGLTEMCEMAYAFTKCYYFDNPEFYLVP